MIGPGDLAIRDLDDDERGCRTCRECDSLYPNDEGRSGLCHGCADRLRPLCACGCGNEATIVADVYCDGEHDCRAPWYSIDDALGATDSNHPVEVRPLDPLADIIAAGPCWCHMRESTVVDWCPSHGQRI
jgi:hypothetical protein